MPKKKILLFAGTRPEAIKLAPVAHALNKRSSIIDMHLCATGQHKEMLSQAFKDFGLQPDSNLEVMTQGQTLAGLSKRLFVAIDEILEKISPDAVLVQGDTTTVQVASLCTFYRGIPLGHIEAGLRSHNMKNPFPEELNRRVTALTADWHFAPTIMAKENLLQEGINSERIWVTGNTVIDALLWMVKQVRLDRPPLPPKVEKAIAAQKRIVLVTGHRRENLGEPFKRICTALLRLSHMFPDVCFVFPVHLNPRIKENAHATLGNTDGICLIEPLAYKAFVRLMDSSTLILTDSGGIQEEGPSLGKPVLIMRDVTERPEGVNAGVNRLVGTNSEKIVAETARALREQENRFISNPYGDGKAAERIISVILSALDCVDE